MTIRRVQWMTRSTRIFVVALGLLLVAAAVETARAEGGADRTFIVVGTGQLKDSSLGSAKEQAIAACKRVAVERMTAEMLPLDTMVQQFATIDSAIFSQADKFIQYYKVLAENQQNNQYRVLVEAKVSNLLLKEKLRSSGILSADARPLIPLTVTVVGTDNLSSFVLFRSSLAKLDGVESIQNKEIGPDQTTLQVNFRGTPNAFADALLTKQYAGFTTRVYQAEDGSFRIELVPAQP
jgi:hypothetical protein